MIQLNPAIPVETSKGKGYAYFLLDYSQDHHIIWGVLIAETREWWWLPNPEVRGQVNLSLGIGALEAPHIKLSRNDRVPGGQAL